MLKRLPPGQSQVTLLQISRRQGNRHVQRLVTAMGNKQELVDRLQAKGFCPSCIEQGKTSCPCSQDRDEEEQAQSNGRPGIQRDVTRVDQAHQPVSPVNGENREGEEQADERQPQESQGVSSSQQATGVTQGAVKQSVEGPATAPGSLLIHNRPGAKVLGHKMMGAAKPAVEDKKKAEGIKKALKLAGGGLSSVKSGFIRLAGGGGQLPQNGQLAAKETVEATSQAMVQAAQQIGQTRVKAQKAAGESAKEAVKEVSGPAQALAEQAKSAAGKAETGQQLQKGLPVKQIVNQVKKAGGLQPDAGEQARAAVGESIGKGAQEESVKGEKTDQKGAKEGVKGEEVAGDVGQETQVPDTPLPDLKPGFLHEMLTSNLNSFREQPPQIALNGQLMRKTDDGIVQRKSKSPLEWARGILNSLRGEASGKKQAVRQARKNKKSQLNQFSNSKLGTLKSQSAAWPTTVNTASQTAQTTMQSQSTTANQQVKSQAAAQSSQAIASTSAKEAQLAGQAALKGDLLKSQCGDFEQKANAKIQSAEQGALAETKTMQEGALLKGKLKQQAWTGHEKSSIGKMGSMAKEADHLFKALQAKAAIEGPSSKGEVETLWSNFVEKKDQDVKGIESKGEELSGKKGVETEKEMIQSPTLRKWLEGTPEDELAGELEVEGEAVKDNAGATVDELRTAASATMSDFANVKESLKSGVQESVQAAAQGLKATAKTTKQAVKQTGKTTLKNAKNTGKTVLSSVRNTTNTMKQAMQNVANTAVSGVKGKGSSIMQFFGSMVNSIVAGVRSVGQSVVQGFKNSISSVIDTVRSTVDSIKSNIRQVVEPARDNFNSVVDSLMEGARAVWDSAKTLIRNTVNRIISLAQRLGQLIQSAIQYAITFVRQQITRIINKIKEAARALAEKIKGLVQWIREKIKALWEELKKRWAALKEKIKAAWEKIKELARSIVYKVCDKKPEKKFEANEKARVEERRKVGDKDWTFNPEDVVKENYQGMGTPQLGNAMKDLAPFINRGKSRDKMSDAEKAKLDAVLKRLAKARGMDPAEAQKQYDKAVQLKSEAKAIAKKQGKEYEYELPPENLMYTEFWGSKEQMAFGNIVGDNLGLDPAFGSMLSPTGGLVGPGANALHLKDSAIGYHGIAHDAAGYLSNFHKIGPGYEYRDQPSWDPTSGLETSDPLAGQVSGINWWSEYLKGSKDEGKMGFLDPELTNFNMGGVNVGIRLEVGMNKGSIKDIFTSPLDPASYADLDLFARLRCQHSKAAAR